MDTEAGSTEVTKHESEIGLGNKKEPHIVFPQFYIPDILHGDARIHYLPGCISMKTKYCSECVLTDGLWPVYFIPEDENWDVGDCFIC